MPKVLVGSVPLRNAPGRFREILHAASMSTVDAPGVEPTTEAEFRALLPDVDAILAGGEPLTAELLALAPRLRVIARTGVGYDAIDLAEATKRKIVVTITPGTNQDSVAEQAFALLLGLTRRIALNDRLVRCGVWDRSLVAPLRGKVLGLVGIGRIGRAMVKKAQAFGMSVIAFDPALPAPAIEQDGVRAVGFDELLAASDVVSLHLPMSPVTKELFDRKAFERMKPGSYFINTARGGLVAEKDLFDALASGHLAGAGLDVLALEPAVAGNPLVGLNNVVTSPHVAGIDTLAMAEMANMAAQTIVDLHQGRWQAECIVNRELAPWSWKK